MSYHLRMFAAHHGTTSWWRQQNLDLARAGSDDPADVAEDYIYLGGLWLSICDQVDQPLAASQKATNLRDQLHKIMATYQVNARRSLCAYISSCHPIICI